MSVDFPSSADDQSPIPFDYGSDLYWLWSWGERLHAALYWDGGLPPSRHDWMVFRPDDLARNAMMRFSVKYLGVIGQLEGYLDFVEKCWTEFSDDAFNSTAESASPFVKAMLDMTERIRVACEVIAEAESKSVATEPTVDGNGTRQHDNEAREKWQFQPGKAFCDEVELVITGIRWNLLKALVEATKPLRVDDLVAAGWPHDSAPDEKTIRTHLSELRKLLRRKLDLPATFNPIPNCDRGALSAWELNATLR